MSYSQHIFNSTQRQQLFQSLKMGWHNVCPNVLETGTPLSGETIPYALYYCEKIQRETIQDIRDASVAVGKVLNHAWSIIKSLDHSNLLKYGFPAESIKLIQNDTLTPFCMRLDWCWNLETGVKKVMENNPQTPSFWFECHEGNDQVANHFGYQPPVVNIQQILSFCLEENIKKAAKAINKPVKDCNVVFTALNNAENLGTMNWLSQHLYQKSTTIPLESLQIQDDEYLLDQRTGKPIDILFMWYPIEWAIHDLDKNVQGLWIALEDLILKQKIVVVNFASAFALQPKSVFALIQDLGLDFFDADEAETILKYFPKTSLNPHDIGDIYFAKPILGKEREGGFAMEAGKVTFSKGSKKNWDQQQQLVYQELLELPQLEIADKMMTNVWSAWLYNDGDDEFIAGGVGMMVSDSDDVTDNLAYWCPIGCD
jgi:glutathionylspermidine synthase